MGENVEGGATGPGQVIELEKLADTIEGAILTQIQRAAQDANQSIQCTQWCIAYERFRRGRLVNR